LHFANENFCEKKLVAFLPSGKFCEKNLLRFYRTKISAGKILLPFAERNSAEKIWLHFTERKIPREKFG
jgi:hypothetical protein